MPSLWQFRRHTCPATLPAGDGRPTDGEQNSLIAEGERGPMKGKRCCHNPPGLCRALLGAAEVQSSREESQPRLPADKRAPLLNRDATLSPPEGQESLRCRVTRETYRANRSESAGFRYCFVSRLFLFRSS